MNKICVATNFYRFGPALFLSLIIVGCSGHPREVRYDNSKQTYSVGKPKAYTSKQEKVSYTVGLNDTATARYHQETDPKAESYLDKKPGNTYTIGKHDGASAHYISREGSWPETPAKTEKTYDIPDKQVADLPMVIEVSDVLFAFDKSEIKSAFVPELEKWVEYFLNNPQVTAEIYGHADSTGSTSYNQRLSEKRAQAIIDYLAAKGVDPARFTAKGFGETQPAAPNTTSEGRQKNRRVELHL